MKRFVRTGKMLRDTFMLFTFILLSIPRDSFSSPWVQNLYPEQEKLRTKDRTVVFRSAMNPVIILLYDSAGEGVAYIKAGKNIHYTIQVCTLYALINDPFLTGRYKIRPIRMGDVYRYVFSAYATLAEARKELQEVQKYFPGAFIREYDGRRLGKAIDLNIEHLE